jgi:protein-S-isoprenylcysteine O-methyltransferase Ste14
MHDDWLPEIRRFPRRPVAVIPLIPHWVFRQRGILADLPLIFALFWTRGETHDPLLNWSLGLSLLALGVAVRIWAQQHLHNRLVKTLEFTFTGPYQLVRNPLYIGNTLIIVGATFFSNLLWMVPISLAWCAIFYSVIVRYEEHGLAKHFGDPYVKYKARVPRWFPQIGAPRHPEFVNEYFGRAVFAELHCFLVIVPFVIKDLLVSSAWRRL